MTPEEREREENPAATKAMDILIEQHGEVYAELCGIVARLSTVAITAEADGAPKTYTDCLKSEVRTLQIVMKLLFPQRTTHEMARDTQAIVRAFFLDIEV